MSFQDKIVNLDKIITIVQEIKKQGGVVGFTNGCFDILHSGHVSYLEKAKELVDILIVGLNSDDSVRRIKGRNRPINPETDRAEVLAAIESVDFVVIFDEDTPIELIKAVEPDVLVKGADWKGREVIGADFVLRNGGRVEFIEYMDNRSTSGIIDKIIEIYCDDNKA